MTSVDDAQIAQFDSRSIPVVAIDAFGDQPDRIPTVGSNNWSGAFSATKHLIDLGHTRIGMISGPIRYLNSRARVDGYRSALESCGLDIDRSLIRYGDFFFTGGALHARDLLTRDNRPTAIFAGSDLQAIGVYRTAQELGIRIPDDLSVVGYDGVQLTEWLSPPLTTIDQSSTSWARQPQTCSSPSPKAAPCGCPTSTSPPNSSCAAPPHHHPHHNHTTPSQPAPRIDHQSAPLRTEHAHHRHDPHLLG